MSAIEGLDHRDDHCILGERQLEISALAGLQRQHVAISLLDRSAYAHGFAPWLPYTMRLRSRRRAPFEMFWTYGSTNSDACSTMPITGRVATGDCQIDAAYRPGPVERMVGRHVPPSACLLGAELVGADTEFSSFGFAANHHRSRSSLLCRPRKCASLFAYLLVSQNAPIAIAINSYPSMVGFQNSVDPPHRTESSLQPVSDERYQVTLSPPCTVRALRRTFTSNQEVACLLSTLRAVAGFRRVAQEHLQY